MNNIQNAGKLLSYKFNGYFNDNYNHFHNKPPVNKSLHNSIAAGDEGTKYSRVWIGQILCKKTGKYYFHTNSDDSSIVSIAPAGTFIDYDKIKTGNTDHNILKNLHSNNVVDSNMVVNNKGLHGMRGRSGHKNLNKDTVYDIIVLFGENYGGAACIMHFRPENDVWKVPFNSYKELLIFAPYILIPMNEQEEKYQELKTNYENYYSQIDGLDDNAQNQLDIVNDNIQNNLNKVEENNIELDRLLLEQANKFKNLLDNKNSAMKILETTKNYVEEAKNNANFVKNMKDSIKKDIDIIENDSAVYVGASLIDYDESNNKQNNDKKFLENFDNIEGMDNNDISVQKICNSENNGSNKLLCAIHDKISMIITNNDSANDPNYALLKRAQNEITEIMATKRNALSDIVFNYLMDPNNGLDNNDNTFTDVIEKIQKDNQFKMRKIKIINDSVNKNRDYLELLKVLVVMFILIIPLIIIRKNELMPENINMALIIIILILTSIYSFYKIYNINNKDPNDYDKINHTKNHYYTDKLISDGKLDKKNSLLKGIGFSCIGEECCTDDMLYDATLNKCKSVQTNSEGFTSMLQKNKHLDSIDKNIDPFKYFTDKYNITNNSVQ